MISLKSLLLETPDYIKVWNPDAHASFGMDAFTDGLYTFFVYKDEVDNGKYWIAWDYIKQKVISSNPNLIAEIYNVTSESTKRINDRPQVESPESEHDIGGIGYIWYDSENINDILNRLKSLNESTNINNGPTHHVLMQLTVITRRGQDNRNHMQAAGRVYHDSVNSVYYFCWWDEHKYVIHYKYYIDDFLKTVGISTSNIKFELDHDYINHETEELVDQRERGAVSNMVSYAEYFEGAVRELTPYEKEMARIRQDLHINKGKMDVAILKVLHSKPKDRDTLYARLEKEFGMPIVQIKHIFGKIPLDKLVSKKLREFIEA